MPKLYRDAATGCYYYPTPDVDAAARPAETVSETTPAHHETPDVAELRRLLANVGAHWQEMPSGYPPDLYGWEVHELTSPVDLDVTGAGLPEGMARLIAAAVNALPALLGKADALLDATDRLAHMTEARDNARAEVDRLTAKVERVRELHRPDPSGDWCDCCWTGPDSHGNGNSPEWPCPTIRILDGGSES